MHESAAEAHPTSSNDREERNARWSEWMRLAQTGDSQAYESLLKEVSVSLRGFLRKRLNQTEAIEDVLQEILLGIHKARATYDPARSFSSWAFAIARYKFTDYLRSRERYLNNVSEDTEVDRLSDRTDDRVDDIQEMLEEALLGLTERDRKIVQKLKLEGRSVKEISKELGMSESAVKVAAHRAYRSMKKQIEKND